MILSELLITLLIGHVLGDFALQTDRVYQLKIRGGLGLAIHVALHVLVTGILLQARYLNNWLLLLLLFVIHYAIDWTKLQFHSQRNLPGFILDQVAHVSSLIFLVWLFPQTSSDIPSEWLYPVLVYGLIPILTMMLWVWSNDMVGTRMDTRGTQRMRSSMKTISQLSSLPLILGLCLWIYLSLVPILLQ